MIRLIAAPLFCVALMFTFSQCEASDVHLGVGVGVGGGYHGGYWYHPYDNYTYNYPYTYDDYGYYTPTYSYTTDPGWYSDWYGPSVNFDAGYWRGNNWDGGRRGSWNGTGTFNSGGGGFSGRGSVRSGGGGGGGGHRR